MSFKHALQSYDARCNLLGALLLKRAAITISCLLKRNLLFSINWFIKLDKNVKANLKFFLRCIKLINN